MKNLLQKVVLGLLSFSLLGGGSVWAQAQAQTRTGTIDLAKVFDNYWKKKQAEAVLKDRAADMEKDYKVMVADFEKGKADYEKALAAVNDSVLSAEERDKRKKLAEDKLKSLKDSEDMVNSYKRQATANLEEQKSRMRNNIFEEIKNVAGAKARAASFSLVIDSSAESAKGTPMVLFNNGDNDLTDSVLAQLNAGAPTELPPAEEKKPTLGTDTNASSLAPVAPPPPVESKTGKMLDDKKK
jgi:outer membrane protein